MVDRVGEVLGLQAEPEVLLVGDAGLAGDRAVQEVARVELHAGLGGQHVHDAAAAGLAHRRRHRQHAAAVVQHVVVVVAHRRRARHLADARPDGREAREVHHRAAHRRDLAGRDQRVVHRREPVRHQHQFVAEDVALPVAGQVEVAVVRQVDDGRLVGGRGVVEPQLVPVGQRVGDRGRQRARVAFLHVRAHVGELHGGAVGRRHDLRPPHALVEALHAAVQVVRPVVGRERVLLAVELELALGDPVADAPDRGAEVRVLALVLLDAS